LLRCPNSWLFSGRQFDGESGLYNLRNRYYNPFAGRFTTKDPIGFRGGINLYAYCLNNPTNLIDPFGLEPEGEKPWWEQLAEGYYYGTGFGTEATERYAQLQLQTGNLLWAIPGSLASLWTPQTYQQTGWTLLAAIGYATGFEIRIGQNFRIAPFGNRTGNSTGELPHYHRRPLTRPAGPGEGISWHRPWESGW